MCLWEWTGCPRGSLGVEVCHGKVVRIPLEGDEILQVHGERTQGVVKTLMNTKVDEPKLSDISVTKVSYDLVIFREEHQCCLLRRGAWSSFEVRVGITEEGEVVTYLRFIANFSKIVKPITSLTERDQKYEWGAERKEAFQTLKNDLCDASINRMYETDKVENAPEKCCSGPGPQMKKRADNSCTLWIKLYSKYEYEIRYHPGKANVVIEALSRKERVKPRHVRAMAMTIQYGVRGMILTSQSEAFKQDNGMMRTVVMDKAHTSRWMSYFVVLAVVADSVCDAIRFGVCLDPSRGWDKSFGVPVLWAEIGESSLIGPELVQETTDKVVLIKEKLKAARDRQKSCADNRRKPLEFEVGERVMLKVSPWKGVIRFGKKGKLAPRYVGPFEILERIGPVAYRLRLPEELSGIEVDKTLRFVEEPVENSDCEVMRLKCSRMVIVKVRFWLEARSLRLQAKWLAVRYLVKVSWNSKCNFELTWVWEDYLKDKYPRFIVWLVKLLVLTYVSVAMNGLCVICVYVCCVGYVRFDNQSIERDRLIGIGFVLDFVEFISFTFSDKEMILVIEAVSR
ncbi:hypothetical protein Tco_0565737 [Tanacetum coccineum]